jgi:hypothetical protein
MLEHWFYLRMLSILELLGRDKFCHKTIIPLFQNSIIPIGAKGLIFTNGERNNALSKSR